MAKQDWFEIWFEDKQSMEDTMRKNMMADLEAGYNPNGLSIRKQMEDIRQYSMQFDREMQEFRTMSKGQIQHWCYYDLKRRGVIS